MNICCVGGGGSGRYNGIRLARAAGLGALFLAASVISGCGLGGRGAAEGQPATCDSTDAKQSVTAIIEDGPDRTLNVKVVDLGGQVERFHDQAAKVRYCAADLVTNVDSGPISYKIYFGPSGQELVEVREGADAYGAAAMAAAARQAPEGTPANVARSAVDLIPPDSYYAPGDGPTSLVGLPYLEAKAALARQGLKPKLRSADEVCGSDALCRRYPETESCAGDAPLCVMAFQDGRGRVLLVTVESGDAPSVLGSRWEAADAAVATETASTADGGEEGVAMLDEFLSERRVGGDEGEYLRCPSIQAARAAITSIPAEGAASEDARYRAYRTRAIELGCTTAIEVVTATGAFETADFGINGEDAGTTLAIAVTARDRNQRSVALLLEREN